MATSMSWIHGNALTVENPFALDGNGQEIGRLVLTPFGWGTQVTTQGHPVPLCWFHIPIPTIYPTLGGKEALKLNRVFLLFRCSDAQISKVHIYDNETRIQEFDSLSLTGEFLVTSAQNTFEVFGDHATKSPYRVKGGIGLSFLLASSILIDQPSEATQPKLLVTAAGAEFGTYSPGAIRLPAEETTYKPPPR